MKSIREAVALALGLLVLLVVVGHCTGCKGKPPVEPGAVETRAKHLIEQEEYGRALAACRADGKDAGSFDVYEACARKADAKAGVQ